MSYQTNHGRPKALLVGIPTPGVTDADNEESLAELKRLVTTLGYDVCGQLSQRRPSHAGGTVLGEGKIKELQNLTAGEKPPAANGDAKNAEGEDENLTDSSNDLPDPSIVKANAVVFDCDLSPSQLANVQRATGVEVLDRTGVIVEIFSRHAKTAEARIQVEIARLRYMAPRVREAGAAAGNQDRMGGTSGETALELDRRKVRDRIAKLRRDLIEVQKEQASRRQRRSAEPTVALVGYTNAGKSSLMRGLTGSDVLVADKLFATLDTTVRTLHPESKPRILVSDTVGFIKKLPHDLVASFRSTLDEAANASLLLFVVDASDSTFRAQLAVTHTVLAEIGIEDIPSRLILNKSDKLDAPSLARLLLEYPDAIPLSTLNPDDVAGLRGTIVSFFEQDMLEEDIHIPYTTQKLVGEIRANMRVIEERYEDDGVVLRVRAPAMALSKLKKDFSL